MIIPEESEILYIVGFRSVLQWISIYNEGFGTWTSFPTPHRPFGGGDAEIVSVQEVINKWCLVSSPCSFSLCQVGSLEKSWGYTGYRKAPLLTHQVEYNSAPFGVLALTIRGYFYSKPKPFTQPSRNTMDLLCKYSAIILFPNIVHSIYTSTSYMLLQRNLHP